MPSGCIFLNKLRELWGSQSGFFFMFLFTRNSAKSHFISGLGQLIIFTISVRCSRLIIWGARTLGYCKDHNGPNLFYAYEMGFSRPSCGVSLNLWSFPQVFGGFWLFLRIWHFPFLVSLFLDFPCFLSDDDMIVQNIVIFPEQKPNKRALYYTEQKPNTSPPLALGWLKFTEKLIEDIPEMVEWQVVNMGSRDIYQLVYAQRWP